MIDASGALLLFALGLVVGTYGTLVGAGGGFLIVPALLLLFGATPPQAVGTSLTVVFFNAVSGTLSYARGGRIDYRAGIPFAVATVPGAILGAFFSQFVVGRLFDVLFGVLLVLLATTMALRPRATPAPRPAAGVALRPGQVRHVLVDAAGVRFDYSYHQLAAIALCLVVGFVSSLFGIGGGIILVPALIYFFSFPPHIATATSLFVLTITAAFGSLSHLLLGHVLVWHAIIMAVGVSLGAQLGARLSRRLSGPWLIRLLSLALVLVGARLIVG